MKKAPRIKNNLQKIKKSATKSSLTIFFSLFAFLIVFSAILLTGLMLFLLTRFGVFVDLNGERQLMTIILFMSATSLVIGGVISFTISRIPLAPITQLIRQMNRLAAGDFKARLTFSEGLSSHPAFREISTSFNRMAEQLESTEMLRGDFVNHFSHEFKTPIVSITGFAKLLAKGNLTEEQRQMYLKSIEEESLRLSVMATNVLNLTKIENQTILTNVTGFNLSEQIRGAVLLLEREWTKKNIDISLDFDEWEIEANEELLKEVWINLIDNAIKFSPVGGTVTLHLADEGDGYRVSVGNTGDPIPEEKLDKVFRKFYQTDESHATKGNGIGLAIVKRIVELHCGEITVSSNEVVTVFSVWLPKRRSDF